MQLEDEVTQAGDRVVRGVLCGDGELLQVGMIAEPATQPLEPDRGQGHRLHLIVVQLRGHPLVLGEMPGDQGRLDAAFGIVAQAHTHDLCRSPDRREVARAGRHDRVRQVAGRDRLRSDARGRRSDG